MAFQKRPSSSQVDGFGHCGKKLYGKRVRMFREGYLSVLVYKNVYEQRTFYDWVIYRKIRVNGKSIYKRGTNLKPCDIPDLEVLLSEVKQFLQAIPGGEIKEDT